MPIVYKITNRTNNKSYVGHTVRTLDARWKSHQSAARQGSRFRFHSAIRKYGIDDWKLEILFEDKNHTICREKEVFFIQHFELMNSKKGYNAKLGGCGGWIVPDHKYNEWKQKISNTNKGLGNGNSTNYTNEELIEIGTKIALKMNRIPGQRRMVIECRKLDIRFPKSFRKYRFEGKYPNYARQLELTTGLKYKPYEKTEEHKNKIKTSNLRTTNAKD